LQASGFSSPSFACGSLYLLSELIQLKPNLKSIFEQPDAAEVDYDTTKRDPQFAGAGSSALWELSGLEQHFHPSVSHFAQTLMKGEKLELDGDPLALFSLSSFLDRFVYKNPRAIKHDRSSGGLRTSRRPNSENDTINSASFLANAGTKAQNVRADEVFFYKYFAERNKRKPKQVKKDSRDAEDEDAIADEEAESFLRSLAEDEDDGDDDEIPDFGDDAYEEGFEPEGEGADGFEYEGGDGLDFDDMDGPDDSDSDGEPSKKKKKHKGGLERPREKKSKDKPQLQPKKAKKVKHPKYADADSFEM